MFRVTYAGLTLLVLLSLMPFKISVGPEKDERKRRERGDIMLGSVDRNLKRFVEKDGGMVGISIAKAVDGSWRVSFYKARFSSSTSSSGNVITREVKPIPDVTDKIEILSRFTSDVITNGIQDELNQGKKKSTSEKVRLQVVSLIRILMHTTH